MRLEDLAGVLTLLEDIAAEGLWIRTEPGFDRKRRLDNWRAQVLDPTAVVIVAVDEHRVVGFSDLYSDAALGPLLGMFVALSYRDRGIGRALLVNVLEAARERG
jgi:ribosomal protein S18 acetylase RimI-like enzyme